MSETIYDKFKVGLEAVNGSCLSIEKKDLADTILQLFKGLDVRDACLVDSDLMKELGVCEYLRENGIEIYTDHIRLHAEKAIGGISEVDHGIAELGSVSQESDDVDNRIVATMPEYYIGVIKESNIFDTYDDMFDYWSSLDPIPNYVGLITGPSRTADIECVSTVGVHGPLKVTIIVLKDL
ncbi:MAG: lactate utilization protein C [Peptoniphilaceae bacterium]|nr:lactate utilization protein C [Peptoniphilaceae bacterium]MDY6019727.1 lactate utilization protein C [Anaerococcus sp.]